MTLHEIPILAPGTVVGDTYEIVREVATGGMGTVYEARNVRLQSSRVAVKVLSKLTSPSSALLPRFRREAEIGASLNHPHIIRVIDWNTLPDESPFFVMEYLEGEPLSKRLRRGAIPFELGLMILGDAGEALSSAHRMGVVHRDLKPSNIFLCGPVGTERPFVKVLDFGISKLIFDETLETTSKLIGTPRYMAPEQVRNLPIDPRADQFSLATVAYEVLGGRAAFPGRALEAILYHVVHDDPEPLAVVAPHLPASVTAAVARGMAKEPDERFPDVENFLRALRGEPVKTAVSRDAPTVAISEPIPGSASETSKPIMNTPAVVAAKRGSTLSLPSFEAPRKLEPPPRRPWLRWLIALVALQAALLVALAYVREPPADPIPDVSPTVETGPVEPFDDTEPSPDGLSPAETNPDVPSKRPPPVPREEAPPPERVEVARRLDEAAAALDAGQHRRAVVLARQSLITQDTARAHRIITVGHCALKDLGAARAAWYKVAPRDRRRVATECKEYGVEL